MPLSQNNQACIRDLSNNGNSPVNSEMGNPRSTYVPLSIHLECWHTSRRGFEHSVELTHWGQTLGKYEVVFWDFGFLSGIHPIQTHPPPAYPYKTPSSLQHVATLPNPQHLYLDSLYSPLPNWSGHPQFNIYNNWCRFKQHAIKLQHSTNIYIKQSIQVLICTHV